MSAIMKLMIERFDRKLAMIRTNRNLQNEVMKVKIDRVVSKKKMCFFECEKNNDRKNSTSCDTQQSTHFQFNVWNFHNAMIVNFNTRWKDSDDSYD